VEISDDAAFAQPRTLLEATNADFANPGDNPVAIPTNGLAGRFVRVTATKLWERTSDYVFALAELETFVGGENVAVNGTVSSFDETKTGAWSGAMLVDGQTSLGTIAPWPQWLEQLSQRQALTGELATLQQRLAEHRVSRQGTWLRIAGGGALAGIIVTMLLHRRQKERQRRALIDLRRQIARDLHDEIGSSLGSIALMSELAMRESGSDTLHDIHRLSREAAESMRGIVWLVREPGIPTLERLVETMRQTAASLLGGVTWELRAPPEPAPPAPSLDFHRHVFLFFKEAVHNIARHARAKSVRIDITWAPSTFTLALHDDGIGFDPARTSAGCGLDNLRHRAAALHGQVDISSAPGEGTRIHLAVPLHCK
jgi:signal transduction histidine kinase